MLLCMAIVSIAKCAVPLQAEHACNLAGCKFRGTVRHNAFLNSFVALQPLSVQLPWRQKPRNLLLDLQVKTYRAAFSAMLCLSC